MVDGQSGAARPGICEFSLVLPHRDVRQCSPQQREVCAMRRRTYSASTASCAASHCKALSVSVTGRSSAKQVQLPAHLALTIRPANVAGTLFAPPPIRFALSLGDGDETGAPQTIAGLVL